MCKYLDIGAGLLQVGVMLLTLIDSWIKRATFDERTALQAASDPPPQGGDPDEIEPEPDPAP